jgi:serine phosphatase RsbU (regulator of sigma subunit)
MFNSFCCSRSCPKSRAWRRLSSITPASSSAATTTNACRWATTADVMGKGTGAALLTASLHAYISTYCERPMELADLVSCLNRSIAIQCDGQIFVTLFAFIIQATDFQMEYCNAGHNEVLLVHTDGRVEQLQEGGTLLGAMPDYPYTSRSIILQPGDLLSLYTDGVTEMEDPAGNMFGKERLIDLLVNHRTCSCPEISRRLLADLDDFRAGAEPHDDVTGILVRCR